MSRTIEVLVSPQGATTIQTKGFAGSHCRDATRELERALGQQIAEQLTSEFHHSSAAIQTAAQQR